MKIVFLLLFGEKTVRLLYQDSQIDASEIAHALLYNLTFLYVCVLWNF